MLGLCSISHPLVTAILTRNDERAIIELNEKLKTALESHFDTGITMKEDQTIESIKYGKTAEFNIEIEDYGTERIEMFLTYLF